MKVTRRSSPFIKQFSGPGENSIICFRFWQAVIASGCPGECAYCFLQTQYPYRTGLYDLKGTIFENLPDIVSEAKAWLAQSYPAGLILKEDKSMLRSIGANWEGCHCLHDAYDFVVIERMEKRLSLNLINQSKIYMEA